MAPAGFFGDGRGGVPSAPQFGAGPGYPFPSISCPFCVINEYVKPEAWRKVDPRPLPFEPTGETRTRTVAGRTVQLRRYVNADGCEVWSSTPPRRRAEAVSRDEARSW